MKIKILTLIGAITLAGCAENTDSVVINQKTAENMSLSNLAASMASVTAAEAVGAVKQFCGVGSNISAAAVKQRLRSASYQELGTARGDSITVFAKTEKAPVVTIGKRGAITVCAVFVDPKEATKEKIEPLLQSRIDSTAFGLPASMLGVTKAKQGDYIWISGKNENHLYMTITSDENRAFAYATR
jgi:hypothetical protein